MGRADYLKIGDWNAQCDRCDFKWKASKLRKTWDDLYVCPKCWEPRHPSDFVRGVKDDPSTAWQRPADTTGRCGPSNVVGQAIAGCAVTGYFSEYTSPL